LTSGGSIIIAINVSLNVFGFSRMIARVQITPIATPGRFRLPAPFGAIESNEERFRRRDKQTETGEKETGREREKERSIERALFSSETAE